MHLPGSPVCRTGCSAGLKIYGWALYFGNVSVRQMDLVRRRWLMRIYRRPQCGTVNLFSSHQPPATKYQGYN
jgi:hypothetical protein